MNCRIDRVKPKTWNWREWWNKINALTRHIKISSNWKLIKTLQRNGKNSGQFKSHSMWLFHWHYSNGNLCGCMRYVSVVSVYMLANKYSHSYSFWVQMKSETPPKKKLFDLNYFILLDFSIQYSLSVYFSEFSLDSGFGLLSFPFLLCCSGFIFVFGLACLNERISWILIELNCSIV